jgi:hypothetical protein
VYIGGAEVSVYRMWCGAILWYLDLLMELFLFLHLPRHAARHIFELQAQLAARIQTPAKPLSDQASSKIQSGAGSIPRALLSMEEYSLETWTL